MKKWHPCKRKGFIKRLRKIGFDGPYSGTRHQFMVINNHRMTIPSNQEYSIPQLRMLIKEVESIIERIIFPDEWNSLK